MTFELKPDHSLRSRAAAWRAFQASWVQSIDQMPYPTPEAFMQLRKMLGLNRPQLARLLRCSQSAIVNWESGRHAPPFYAWLALQLIWESTAYRLAADQWRDWRVRVYHQGGRDVTALENPKTGAWFEPQDLEHLWWLHNMKLPMLEANLREAQEKLAKMEGENTELRTAMRDSGLTDKLWALQDQVEDLVRRVATAKVMELPKREAA